MKRLIVLITCILYGLHCSAQKDWVTNHYFDDHPVGLIFSYNNQNVENNIQGFISTWDGIWESGVNNHLHGGALGIIVQGNWGYGIGLYWGMLWEFYMSSNDPTAYDYAYYAEDAFDLYLETALSMPLHLQFKVPLSDNFAVGAHSGLGATWSFIGEYSDSRGYFADYEPLGEHGHLKKINLTWDFALLLQFETFRFDIQWSRGLTNHVMYYGEDGSTMDMTRRNKFTFGFTVFM